jgi:hypothetical protein
MSYFNWAGIASFVLWLVVPPLILLVFLRPRGRVLGHLFVFALAFLAVGFAWINSEYVDEYEKEPAGLFGMLPPRPSEAEEKKKEPEYEYRKAGKQERRAPTSEPSSAAPDSSSAPVSAAPASTAPPASSTKPDAKPAAAAPVETAPPSSAAPDPARKARMLPEDQYDQARLFEKANRYAAQVVCLASLLAALWSLGQAVRERLAGGGSLGAWSPSARAVCLHSANPFLVRKLLERLVRRGERFVYLGPNPPRLHLAEARTVGGAADFLEIRLNRCETPEELQKGKLLFEPVWYGYACLVVAGAEAVGAAWKPLESFLAARRESAPAAGKLNVVCAVREFPSSKAASRLAELCRAADARLVLVAPGDCPLEYAALCEEQFTPAERGR